MSLFIKSVTLPSNAKIGILEHHPKLLHIEKLNGVIKVVKEYEVATYCVDYGSPELIELISKYSNYNKELTLTIDRIFKISDDVHFKYRAFVAHCLQNKIVINDSQIEPSKVLISLGANLEQIVNNIQICSLDEKMEKIDIDFV